MVSSFLGLFKPSHHTHRVKEGEGAGVASAALKETVGKNGLLSYTVEVPKQTLWQKLKYFSSDATQRRRNRWNAMVKSVIPQGLETNSRVSWKQKIEAKLSAVCGLEGNNKTLSMDRFEEKKTAIESAISQLRTEFLTGPARNTGEGMDNRPLREVTQQEENNKGEVELKDMATTIALEKAKSESIVARFLAQIALSDDTFFALKEMTSEGARESDRLAFVNARLKSLDGSSEEIKAQRKRIIEGYGRFLGWHSMDKTFFESTKQEKYEKAQKELGQDKTTYFENKGSESQILNNLFEGQVLGSDDLEHLKHTHAFYHGQENHYEEEAKKEDPDFKKTERSIFCDPKDHARLKEGLKKEFLFLDALPQCPREQIPGELTRYFNKKLSDFAESKMAEQDSESVQALYLMRKEALIDRVIEVMTTCGLPIPNDWIGKGEYGPEGLFGTYSIHKDDFAQKLTKKKQD